MYGGVLINSHCAWAGGTCASFPDFCDNCQFQVIYCVYSRLLELYTVSLPPPLAGFGKLPALAGRYFDISLRYYCALPVATEKLAVRTMELMVPALSKH